MPSTQDILFMTVVPEETVEPKVEVARRMCCRWATSPQRAPLSEVIVDTGATKSACGTRSMDRLLGALQCPFEVSLEDRPCFKFGDGRSLRAVSKIRLWTCALGWLSFYLLDDESSRETNTPLVLGGRALKALQAILSYGHGIMTFRRDEEKDLAVLPLYPTKNGHIAVDLSESATTLGFLYEFVSDEFDINLDNALGLFTAISVAQFFAKD